MMAPSQAHANTAMAAHLPAERIAAVPAEIVEVDGQGNRVRIHFLRQEAWEYWAALALLWRLATDEVLAEREAGRFGGNDEQKAEETWTGS